jgi:hypothetical protein
MHSYSTNASMTRSYQLRVLTRVCFQGLELLIGVTSDQGYPIDRFATLPT